MSTSYARQLRQNATDAEMVLWRILRSTDFKFRRQQPIGRYVVDFVCFSHKLIIECDGGQHADNLADMARDRWFSGQGFRTMRFWNNDILSNQEGVARVILEALCPPLLTPALSPRGRGLG